MPPENLDPDDWHELELAFQQALDAGMQHIRNLEHSPVWKPAPDEIVDGFRSSLPREPTAVGHLVDTFRDRLLPYSKGNTHPSFFGWVHGGGTLQGALGEFCAAIMNSNLGGRDHIAVTVERQVIQWMRELFHFPAEASGLVTSGTSMATLTALAVARDQALGSSARSSGLQTHPGNLVGYGSTESHGSIAKAFSILGLGTSALRTIPVNADFRMDTQALRKAIHQDRANGHEPFCVIATVGTVNTGSIDDIAVIARICHEEGLWLHIDAAFGGALALLPEFAPILEAIAEADSLSFDFHKWFQVPYAAGGVLVRDPKAHRNTFMLREEYLTTAPLGLAGGDPWFCDYGPELSRGFLALKVWFTLQAIGTDHLARIIRKHCHLATRLAGQIDAEPELERHGPVPANIVCFRFRARGSACPDILNEAIVTQLQMSGSAAPSTTSLKGQRVIRVAIVNHRTESCHIDSLLHQTLKLGRLLDNKFGDLLRPTADLLGINAESMSNPFDRTRQFPTVLHNVEGPRQELVHQCVNAGGFRPLHDRLRDLTQAVVHRLSINPSMAETVLCASFGDALSLSRTLLRHTPGHVPESRATSPETGQHRRQPESWIICSVIEGQGEVCRTYAHMPAWGVVRSHLDNGDHLIITAEAESGNSVRASALVFPESHRSMLRSPLPELRKWIELTISDADPPTIRPDSAACWLRWHTILSAPPSE